LIVNEIILLEDLATRYTRGILIDLSEETHGLTKLEQLHEVLRGYPGNCELQLRLCLADGRRVACKCDGMRLAVNDEMRGRVDQLLGPGHFRLLTAAPATTAGGRGNGWSRG
jgi:DNA polymerase-3 subunit alpha